eukprot:Sspe_Gene.5260::Locus_1731_Transcript_1_1_Confidence_1.000_Length_2059::g.5260::m.5260
MTHYADGLLGCYETQNTLPELGGLVPPPFPDVVSPPPPLEEPVVLGEDKPASSEPRAVSLSVKQRTKPCDAECKGKFVLEGTTTQSGWGGRFEFCSVNYKRSECIRVEATSSGLHPDVSPKICIDHGKWTELDCNSEVRVASQYRPFGPFLGHLFDAYGNRVVNCQRDFESCKIAVREMLEGDAGYTVGNDTRGKLSSLAALHAEPANGEVKFRKLVYTHERVTHPLRLELVGGEGGSITAACSGP